MSEMCFIKQRGRVAEDCHAPIDCVQIGVLGAHSVTSLCHVVYCADHILAGRPPTIREMA
jgi:hypothetical protein